MPSFLVITKIVPQKNHPERKSVYIDGKLAFGISADLLHNHGLEENKHLTPLELKRILWSVDKAKLKERAFRLLAFRPRSEKEIRQKLRLKGAGNKLIEQVVEELKEKGLIDDQKFAASWAESRISNRPMGKFLLRRELMQKGIKKETIEGVIEKAYSEEDEVELARNLLQRKAKTYKNLEDVKTKKRMMDFLLRRGFSYEVVRQAIKDIDELIEA
jgi:regulatory protein